MQFSFSKADALKILRTVLRAVPETHALPALTCFHLRADSDSYELTVTGGNETSRIQIAMPVAVSAGGAIAVNAKTFTSAIAAMSGSIITIKTSGGGIDLIDDFTEFHFPVSPEEQYPQLKIPDAEQEVTIPGSVFTTLCRETVFATVAHKASGDALEMLHFSTAPGKLTVMAGDGLRVACATLPLPECRQSLSFLLPVPVVNLLINTLDKDTEYRLGITPRMAVFRAKDIQIAVSPVHLPYPDFSRVLAAHQTCYEALVNTTELQNSLSLASVAAPGSAVRLLLDKERMELKPAENGVLSGTLSIPCQCNKPTPKEGFYYLSGKLLSALKNHPSPSVLLKIASDGLLRIDGESTSYLQLSTLPKQKKARSGKSQAA